MPAALASPAAPPAAPDRAATGPAASPTAAPAPDVSPTSRPGPLVEVIGRSYGGRPIRAYRFGNGPTAVLFVGGMHGGYEWNTALLAYQVIDYLVAHPKAIPESLRVHVIPTANPDGQALVTGRSRRFSADDIRLADTFPGRFNGRGVDLNRNWDCLWSPDAYWGYEPVDPGAHPFSEPESAGLRDFILDRRPGAVIFWHSAANQVVAAGCGRLLAASQELAGLYGAAAGYEARDEWAAYPITGDAGNYLAAQGIPAVTVELTTHESLDWPQNLNGVLAVLDHYQRVAADRDCGRHLEACR
jgi:predicted deacylase